MVRFWRRAVDYSERFTGAESGSILRSHFLRQTAQGWFKGSRLYSGTLTQSYRWKDAELTLTLEGHFQGDRLVEGRKLLNGFPVQEKSIDANGLYTVVNYDLLSQPIRKICFDQNKKWLRTEYYKDGALAGLKTFCPTVDRIVTRKQTANPSAPLPEKEGEVFEPFYELRDEEGRLCYSGGCEGILPNGSGSLFARGRLHYTGGFSLGKRTGFGRIYSPAEEGESSAIKYEGFFEEDLFDGPGTLFLPGNRRYEGMFRKGLLFVGKELEDGRLIYEGGFLGASKNGDFLYHGEGALFHKNGTLRFEGTFTDGLCHGSGTVFLADGSKAYCGLLCAGKPCSDGTIFLPGGERLELDSHLPGRGLGKEAVVLRHYDAAGRLLYSGGAVLLFREAEKGFFPAYEYQKHGWGIVYKPNGERFEGNWEHGKRFGPGNGYYADDQLKSRGLYEDDLLNGEGWEYSPTGKLLCHGIFVRGSCVEGEGVFSLKNGETYAGTVRARYRTGEARVLYPEGQLKYAGNFKENHPSGTGTEYYKNGRIKYSGSFRKGLYDGEGTLYEEDGRLKFRGLFQLGAPRKAFFSENTSLQSVIDLTAQPIL